MKWGAPTNTLLVTLASMVLMSTAATDSTPTLRLWHKGTSSGAHRRLGHSLFPPPPASPRLIPTTREGWAALVSSFLEQKRSVISGHLAKSCWDTADCINR